MDALSLLFLLPFFPPTQTTVFLFLNDFIGHSPYTLYTFTCWGKQSRIDMGKSLSNALHSEMNAHTRLTPSHILVDMSCDRAESLMAQAANHNLFTPTYNWLLLNSSYHSDLRYFFPIGSNVYFVDDMPNGYRVSIGYNPSPAHILVKTVIGQWTKRGWMEFHDRKPQRSFGMTPLKISYVVEDLETINHLNDHQYDILKDTMTKLNYALLQQLVSMVNASKIDVFRRHLVDGMINDLKNGTADVGGTPIELLSDRLVDLDILAQTASVENTFIFKATPHSYIGNVFTLPFDSYVWYSCFGLIAIIFGVAYVVVYWEWRDPIFSKLLVPRLCLRPDPVDIFLMEVGSAAQQGFESEPRSNSGRIVFIFTLISLMFLYTSFSASIVALLQSTTESLNNLESLFESRIPVGFQENISMEYFKELRFENKSREVYNKIRKPLFLPLKTGIKRVQKDFFAFYAKTPEIYKHVKDWFSESEKCSLRTIAFKSTHVSQWLFMRKNSPSRDILRAGLNKINESGIRSREFKRLFTPKPSCDSVGGNFESVGLADSYGAFLVMVAGVVMSVALVLIENLSVKYRLYAKIQGWHSRVYKRAGDQ